MAPFLSVIMPVYNLDMHISAAVNSVLAQTYTDFELLLIDDCSDDNSGHICDKLAESDSRIKVIHLETNCGAGNARNFALDEAKGIYITFIDADDYIESDMFAVIFESVSKNAPKVAVSGMIEDYYVDVKQSDELKYTKRIVPEKMILTSQKDVREYAYKLEELTLYGYPVNKWYDLQHIRNNSIKFPDGYPINEDFIFNLHFFMDIDSANILDIAKYHYNKRQNKSQTGIFIENYYELNSDRLLKMIDQYKYWNMYDNNVKTVLANFLVRYTFSALERNCEKDSGMNSAARKKWLRDYYDSFLYNELIGCVHSGSKMVSVMACLLRNKSVFPSLALAKLVCFVKSKLPILFAKLKQNR